MGMGKLNIGQIKRLWSKTDSHLNENQKQPLYQIIYGRANELLYHHNLILQYEIEDMTEREIFVARECLKLYDQLFAKDFEDHAIDFNFSYDLISQIEVLFYDSTGYALVYVIYGHGSEATLSVLKRIIREIKFKNLKINDTRRIGEKHRVLLDQINHKEYYTEKMRKIVLQGRIGRSKEIMGRINYINSLDYENLIFKREGDKYSRDEWLSQRIEWLKQVNLRNELQLRYIRYGIPYNTLNIEFIDAYIFNDSPQFSLIFITRDFKYLVFNYFKDVSSISEILGSPFKLIDLMTLTYSSDDPTYYKFYESNYKMTPKRVLNYYQNKWEVV